ncbi:MAG: hypothetical protein IJ644_05850, partial [Oscillospiraceae bacterium]|nr:hypothetical protein [Oscillospiraceae bacterium]
MKLKKNLAILLSAGIMLSGASGAYCEPVSKPMVVSAAYESEINRVVELVNQERAAKGIAPVTASPLMMQAAAARAEEITGLFSSKRPNGQSGITILKEYGINASQGGENIAYGQDDAEEVIGDWMTNSNQKGRILNSSYKYIGVGVTYSGGMLYWVQLFANDTGESIETPPTETETTPTETTTTTTTSTTETTTTTTTTTTPETTTTTTT